VRARPSERPRLQISSAPDAAGLWPGEVVTKISEAGRFWEAEAEDQHYLQHYPDDKNQFRR
jgi:peptide-methionine (S)-S-oxide reductase